MTSLVQPLAMLFRYRLFFSKHEIPLSGFDYLLMKKGHLIADIALGNTGFSSHGIGGKRIFST